MLEMYGIANCDTVKKARLWLSQAGLACNFHDFKKTPPSLEQLHGWARQVGWQRLLNRQGSTWRKLDAIAQQAVTDEASACALMQAHPSLIKRPVVQWPGDLSVGFDESLWQERRRGL